MNPMFSESQKKYFVYSVIAVFILLALFLGVQVLNAMKGYSYIGRGSYPSNVITVNGKGEVMAVPDTGSFSFSVVETAKTTAEASDMAAKKMNAIIASLKALGIDEKDIKTSGYNMYPKYEYSPTVCTQYSCPPSKQTLTGYEVDENVTVKIRKTADSGKVLSKVAELGASNVSGLSFVIDDEEKVMDEARDKAIADAREKASRLAKALGVSLGNVVSFNDSNVGYPMPMYSLDSSGAGKVMNQAARVAPELPPGQNTITSNVTIVYEIH